MQVTQSFIIKNLMKHKSFADIKYLLKLNKDVSGSLIIMFFTLLCNMSEWAMQRAVLQTALKNSENHTPLLVLQRPVIKNGAIDITIFRPI